MFPFIADCLVYKWPRKLSFPFNVCYSLFLPPHLFRQTHAEISYNEFRSIKKAWRSLTECPFKPLSNFVFFSLFIISAHRLLKPFFSLWMHKKSLIFVLMSFTLNDIQLMVSDKLGVYYLIEKFSHEILWSFMICCVWKEYACWEFPTSNGICSFHACLSNFQLLNQFIIHLLWIIDLNLI